MPTADAAPSRLDALTGLRFAAAAVVVLSHSRDCFGIEPRWYDFINGMNLGGMGVTFFFILSGFILTHVYPSLKSNGERGRFLLARFARIWPAHALGNLVMIVIVGGSLLPAPAGYTQWGTLFRTLAMLNSWIPAQEMLDAYDGPTWSISAEFFFYLCFIFLIFNWERTWWWKVLLTVAFPVAVFVAAPSLGLPDGGPSSVPNYETFLYYNPLARLYQFCLGMVTALAWRNYRHKFPSSILWATSLEIVVVAVVLLSGYYSINVSSAAGVRFTINGHGLIGWMHGCSSLQALPFAALIFVFANGTGLISSFFATRTVVLLGEISYGVYILHFPLLEYYRINRNAFGLWPGWQGYLVFWALLLLLSHWLWVGMERPARRAILGLLPARQIALAERTARIRPLGSFGATARLRAFLAPRRLLVVESAIVLIAMVGLGFQAAGASFHFIRPDQVATSGAERLPIRNVRFGDAYLLRSISVVRVNNGFQLRTIWESLAPQNDWFHAMVQFKNKKGDVFNLIDGANKFPRKGVSPGQVWEQRFYMPGELCDDSDQIVMVLFMPRKAGEYPIIDGPVDESGRLIIVPQGTKLH